MPSLTTGGRGHLCTCAKSSAWRIGLAALLLLGLTITASYALSRTACTGSASNIVQHPSSTPAKSAAAIPVWKTIVLGEYRNVHTIRLTVDNSACPIGLGDSVDEAIGRPAFPFTKPKLELDLVVVSAADLGFPEDGASLQNIYARAAAIGLELCPADLGPALRLNYLDQPRGEFLHIAMWPVGLYSGELVDFTVGNDGAKLLLVGGNGRPEIVLPGSVKFVFVRPHDNTITHDNEHPGSEDLATR